MGGRKGETRFYRTRSGERGEKKSSFIYGNQNLHFYRKKEGSARKRGPRGGNRRSGARRAMRGGHTDKICEGKQQQREGRKGDPLHHDLKIKRSCLFWRGEIVMGEKQHWSEGSHPWDNSGVGVFINSVCTNFLRDGSLGTKERLRMETPSKGEAIA